MSDPDFAELEPEFGEVMELLREGSLELPSEAPGEHVWSAIAQSAGGAIGAAAAAEAEAKAAAEADEVVQPGGLVSLDSRRPRGRRMAIFTAAAAAVLLVAVPLVLATRGGDDLDQRADLIALDGFAGAGRAELSGRTLEIDVDGLESEDGSFYELWLLDLEGDDVEDLRSLGPVADDGSYTIPEDVDLTRFSVVDVSLEPDDGNPDHSGASVLRGGLQ